MNGRTSALLAGCVLLAACSGDAGTPGNLPPLTPSPTTSAASSPSPLPSELTANNAFGASAFTKHWFQVLNDAYETLDTSRLKALSDPNCNACAGFTEAIDRVSSEGQRFRATSFSLDFAESSPPEATGALVLVRYDVSASDVLNQDGKVVRTDPAREDQQAQALVIFVDGAWRMRGLREISP